MNRPFIIGGIGLLVLVGALAWNYLATVETGTPVAETPVAQPPAAPTAPAQQSAATESAAPRESATAEPQQAAEKPAAPKEQVAEQTATPLATQTEAAPSKSQMQAETAPAQQEPTQQQAAQSPVNKPAETVVTAEQKATESAAPSEQAKAPVETAAKPAPAQSAARAAAEAAPQQQVTKPASPQQPSVAQKPAEPPAQQTAAATPTTEPTRPPLAEPTFDVVRVNPDGNAVIAGRAPPGAEVVIQDGERELGRVVADARGEWVFLPDKPLPPGTRELGLRARLGDRESRSQQMVMLAVPEPKKDIAGQPSESPSGALALMVGRDSASPTRVLQRPSDTAKSEAKPQAPAAQTAEKPAAVVAETTPQPPQAQPRQATAPAGAPRQTAAATRPAPQPKPPVTPAPGTPDITIELIAYGADGQLNISGRAQPGATLLVYLDNRLIGRTEVDQDGGWQLEPQDPIEAGLYKLRVDQLEAVAGKVVARAEMPFERANIASGDRLLDEGTWIVQPGNSLWRIARRKYGTGFRYWDIFEANAAKIRDPDLIYPGQVFSIPTVN